jgi:Fe-S cluster assembly ATPase SufC
MELVFNHLHVDISKKSILKDVSGIAKTGCLTAIMGPSGGLMFELVI